MSGVWDVSKSNGQSAADERHCKEQKNVAD